MNYYLSVLKKYAVFNGRACRAELWYFFLFNLIISFMIGLLGRVIDTFVLNDIYQFYQLAILIPSIAVGVRRMHDVNKSGWFILIPIYNLILAITDGSEGDNKYGPDPKSIGTK